MPTVTVSYRDLCWLLGKHIGQKTLKENLLMMGIDSETVGDEFRLEVPHNRPDLLSVEGIARALKGFLGIKTGLPLYRLQKSDVFLEVDGSTKAVRPFVAGGVVEGVRFTDEGIAQMMQIQDNLHETLGRNRRKVAVGIHDMRKVRPPFRYMTVAPDEIKFVPLDMDRELTPAQILREHPKGIEYGHLLRDFPRYPLILDSEKEVLSMPPIINGQLTQVTEETRKLFIEVTGTEERAVNQVLTILMTGFAERGFRLRSVEVRYPKRRLRTPNLNPTKHKLSVAHVNELIGLDLRPRQVSAIAKRMRYGVADIRRGSLTLLAPPYRIDLMHEVDLMEDISIGYGYYKLEPTLPPIITVGKEHPLERFSDRAREVLTGLGFMETMTFTLTNPRTNFELMRLRGEAATVSNPVSEEYTILRTWLLPCLLDVLRQNKHYKLPQRVFEIGDVVLLDPRAETGARNVRRVAAVVIGDQASFTYTKAVAEALLQELGIDWKVEPIDHPSFLEGRVAEFLIRGKRLGLIGEIHPEVILGFELEHPVAAFELDLSW